MSSREDLIRSLHSRGYYPGQKVEDLIKEDSGPSSGTVLRCAMPDFVIGNPQEAQWPNSCLEVPTSHRLSSLSGMSPEDIHAVWLEAIEAWNRVCGIKLSFTDQFSSAKIHASPGSMGGGTLAFSYLPQNSCAVRLEQQYNKSVQWRRDLLLNVAIHEIGHAIGLNHGPSGSIMQPTANGSITKPQSWDIREVVSRYGPPKDNPPPPPPPPVPGVTVTGKILINGVPYVLVPENSSHDMG